jgi:hypothetical protein
MEGNESSCQWEVGMSWLGKILKALQLQRLKLYTFDSDYVTDSSRVIYFSDILLIYDTSRRLAMQMRNYMLLKTFFHILQQLSHPG